MNEPAKVNPEAAAGHRGGWATPRRVTVLDPGRGPGNPTADGRERVTRYAMWREASASAPRGPVLAVGTGAVDRSPSPAYLSRG